MSDVTIFTPAPILTVTVEEHQNGDEVHIHAGGQGVWQARMLRSLGVSVSMCCVLTGETGTVLKHLLEDEGFDVVGVEREGRGPSYLHDRREGKRTEIAKELGDALGRHDLDEVYSLVLREGLASSLVILSGPAGEDVLPADTYRRLAADLRQGGAKVIVDLSGDRLDAAVDGGVDVLKVSHEELKADGLISEPSASQIQDAMRTLRERGADVVIVTRASDSLLFLDGEGFLEVTPPRLEVADTRGAGDSLTAGVVAAMAAGESPRDAITLGAAAGALNVTRHGLGTGDAGAIHQLRGSVAVRTLDEDRSQGASGRVSPDGLAALAQQDES